MEREKKLVERAETLTPNEWKKNGKKEEKSAAVIPPILYVW